MDASLAALRGSVLDDVKETAAGVLVEDCFLPLDDFDGAAPGTARSDAMLNIRGGVFRCKSRKIGTTSAASASCSLPRACVYISCQLSPVKYMLKQRATTLHRRITSVTLLDQ